jgi:hypothetical protein
LSADLRPLPLDRQVEIALDEETEKKRHHSPHSFRARRRASASGMLCRYCFSSRRQRPAAFRISIA